KATQKRVINLFVQELGYTYLGDFTERKNSNIETELLTKFLTGKGYSSVLIRRALEGAARCCRRSVGESL
ncbi:MAG: hypothetical protein ACLTCQ_21750, partial [Enterocloster bolteae]